MVEKENNYLEVNKKLWNTKTEFHVKSDFYNVEGFLKGQNSLNSIIYSFKHNIE